MIYVYMNDHFYIKHSFTMWYSALLHTMECMQKLETSKYTLSINHDHLQPNITSLHLPGNYQIQMIKYHNINYIII